MKGAVRRVGIEVVGWTLVLAGIAALILPGPGLLMLAGGLVVLSQQYEWAERRVDPVKRQALKGAAQSVQTWPRILMTSLLIAVLVACGVLWIVGPAVPGWYPLAERYWLPGGKATGITWLASAALALGLLVWSYRTYHGNPEAVAAVMEAADGDEDHDDEAAASRR